MGSTADITAGDELRYPVGRYRSPAKPDANLRSEWIQEIERLPQNLRRATDGLDDRQLDTPYRPGGWTVRQVAHHLADSHLNSYTRFRLAVTEDNPRIKTYEEAAWAELADAKSAPIDLSLTLLEALHARWVLLLLSFSEVQWTRRIVHPEWGELNVEELLAQYEWHCRHHLAHIAGLRERQGW